MDARAGENDTPTKLKKVRINTRLNRRKKAIQKQPKAPKAPKALLLFPVRNYMTSYGN